MIEGHFRGWTADGLVRQAAFKGTSEDKPPREVVREMPVVTDTKADHMSKHRIAAEAAKTMTKTSKPRLSARKMSSGGGAKAQSDGDVRFTHPDRVYWVDVGVTKQDLAEYYRSVWDWMAPHVVGRPLALVRCPD